MSTCTVLLLNFIVWMNIDNNNQLEHLWSIQNNTNLSLLISFCGNSARHLLKSFNKMLLLPQRLGLYKKVLPSSPPHLIWAAPYDGDVQEMGGDHLAGKNLTRMTKPSTFLTCTQASVTQNKTLSNCMINSSHYISWPRRLLVVMCVIRIIWDDHHIHA